MIVESVVPYELAVVCFEETRVISVDISNIFLGGIELTPTRFSLCPTVHAPAQIPR